MVETVEPRKALPTYFLFLKSRFPDATVDPGLVVEVLGLWKELCHVGEQGDTNV